MQAMVQAPHVLRATLTLSGLVVAFAGCSQSSVDGSCTVVAADGGGAIIRCSDGTEAAIPAPVEDTSCTVSEAAASRSVDCDDGSGATISRIIHLPVESVTINNPGAAYELNGGADLSGLALRGTELGRFSAGFTVPADYVPGTDLTVQFVWGNSQANAVDCNFFIRSNGVARFRPGVSPSYGNGRFPESTYYDQSELVIAAGSAGGQVRGLSMTIVGTAAETPVFAPGDAVVFRIIRDPEEADDTCTGDFFLLGMHVTY